MVAGEKKTHTKKIKQTPRKTKRRRKCRGHVNVGGSILSLLKGAAKVGIKLGKSKRYKRIGALDVGGAVSNFRRRPWAV